MFEVEDARVYVVTVGCNGNTLFVINIISG
jgi:hypothetical protein